MYVYGWQSTRVEDWEIVPADSEEKPKAINTAWRFQYPDPENAHRESPDLVIKAVPDYLTTISWSHCHLGLTQWATGLTVNYDP